MDFTNRSALRTNSDAYVAYNNTSELNSKIYTYWSKNMFDQHLRTLDKSLDKMYLSKRSSILQSNVSPNIIDTEPTKKSSQEIIKSLRNFFGDYMIQSQKNILNNNNNNRYNTLSIAVFTNLGISPELFKNSQTADFSFKRKGSESLNQESFLFRKSDLNDKFKDMSLNETTVEKSSNTMIGLNQFGDLRDYTPSPQKSLSSGPKRKGGRGSLRLQSKSYAVSKKHLLKKQTNRQDLVEVLKDDINTLSEIEWSSTDDEKLGEEKLKLHFKLAEVRSKKQKKKKNRETGPEVAKKVDVKVSAQSSSDGFDSESSYYLMSEPSKKRSSDSDSICIVSTDIDSESDKDLVVMDKSVGSDKQAEESSEIVDLDYMISKEDHFVTSDSSENDEGETKKRKESSDDSELIATEILSSIEDTDFKESIAGIKQPEEDADNVVEVDVESPAVLNVESVEN